MNIHFVRKPGFALVLALILTGVAVAVVLLVSPASIAGTP